MKRRLLVVTLLLVLSLSFCILAACGDDKMEKATITSIWRDDEFSRAVPKMECGKLFSITDFVKHDRVLYVVNDVTREDFDAYCKAMTDFGYTEKSVDKDAESGTITIEYKRDGWKARLFFGGSNINLKVYKK